MTKTNIDERTPLSRMAVPATPGWKPNADPSIRRGVVRITNSTGGDAVLVLEPWGDEHPMPVGAVLEVVYEGPAGGDIEIEVQAGRILVFGWTGSTLDVRTPAKRSA